MIAVIILCSISGLTAIGASIYTIKSDGFWTYFESTALIFLVGVLLLFMAGSVAADRAYRNGIKYGINKYINHQDRYNVDTIKINNRIKELVVIPKHD